MNRRGLRSWTTGWQQAAESSLDPNNENGPIPFTSSSLLALAYVRIHLNLGPYRHLETRDTSRIAKALSRSPCVERSDGVIAALLYAVHMLSIPVRLGIDRVARSQAFFWSVRHTLSSLDCSILLSKWLGKLGETMASAPLTGRRFPVPQFSIYLLSLWNLLTYYGIKTAKTASYIGYEASWKKRTTLSILKMKRNHLATFESHASSASQS